MELLGDLKRLLGPLLRVTWLRFFGWEDSSILKLRLWDLRSTLGYSGSLFLQTAISLGESALTWWLRLWSTTPRWVVPDTPLLFVLFWAVAVLPPQAPSCLSSPFELNWVVFWYATCWLLEALDWMSRRLNWSRIFYEKTGRQTRLTTDISSIWLRFEWVVFGF